jgi:hypothetical protein
LSQVQSGSTEHDGEDEQDDDGRAEREGSEDSQATLIHSDVEGKDGEKVVDEDEKADKIRAARILGLMSARAWGTEDSQPTSSLSPSQPSPSSSSSIAVLLAAAKSFPAAETERPVKRDSLLGEWVLRDKDCREIEEEEAGLLLHFEGHSRLEKRKGVWMER